MYSIFKWRSVFWISLHADRDSLERFGFIGKDGFYKIPCGDTHRFYRVGLLKKNPA
jgi:hypothetical protein